MTKSNENLMIFNYILCLVSLTFSVQSGYSLKLQTNQRVLTFKVKVKSA